MKLKTKNKRSLTLSAKTTKKFKYFFFMKKLTFRGRLLVMQTIVLSFRKLKGQCIWTLELWN